MITAQEAAAICGKPKKQGKGWMCQCPAHEDNNPSLKIDDGQGDTLLVKCFSGCEQSAVIAAMESIGAWPKFHGKSDDRRPVIKKKAAVKKTTRKKIVDTYDYVSSDGELLFQSVRYDPKSFNQRRPGPAGKWIWNLKDVELVPFLLPELIGSIKKNRYVFVVEGEKDALAMRDSIGDGGATATCCPMGAGKWKAEFNKYFEGAGVIIVADNDDPGRKHAVEVAEQLRTVADVRIWELPGVPEHGDISDWIAEGGTKKHLTALVKEIFKDPMRYPDDPAPAPSSPPPKSKPALGVVEPSGAVRKPEDIPEEKPELATDGIMAMWKNLLLVLNGNNRPHANLDNALRVIEGDAKLKGHIIYDEFYDRVKSDLRTEKEGVWEDWKDGDTVWLTLLMQRQTHIPNMKGQQVHDAVMAAAARNPRNAPREYMMDLVWDGTDRLKHLMSVGFGSAANEYTEAVGRCFVMGMVARILKPGCKVDNMPVFEGPQGGFKSSALAALGGEWFTECHEPVTSKDFYQVMQGRMLIEISELHAFRKSEVERIKGIISCPVDRYRRSYGRLAEDHPRMSVFSGTTNTNDWNADETGARRFWPITCGYIDLDWIADSRDQLFAEAVVRVRDKEEPWWDVPEQEAVEEQEFRRKNDVWEEYLEQYISDSPKYDHETRGLYWQKREQPLDVISIRLFMEEALQLQPGKQARADQLRLTAALRAMGWYRTRIVRKWCYVAPGHPQNPLVKKSKKS